MSLPASLPGTLRLPVIGAPMFIVSGPELVIAQCKAGIIGGIPALNAGLDPGNLPEADKSTMDFGSGVGSKAKAWRDIWGAGLGVGTIHDILPVADLVSRLEAEYREALTRLTADAGR